MRGGEYYGSGAIGAIGGSSVSQGRFSVVFGIIMSLSHEDYRVPGL